MAFNDKYAHSFTSVDGDSYSWEIQKEGYVGSPTTLQSRGRGHIVTTWRSSEEDEFAPMMPSETQVSFYDTASGDVLTDVFASLTNQDWQHALFIKDGGGDVVWRGFIETTGVAANEDGPLKLSLTAHDGLGRLDDIPYVATKANLTLNTGRYTATTIIADLLGEIGWGIDIYIAANLYPRHGSVQLTAAQNPLDSIYIDRHSLRDKSAREDAQETPVSCGDALRAILRRFGLQVKMWDGAWHVIQQDLLYNATYRRWLYDSDGVAKIISGGVNYEDFTVGITPGTESLERTEAVAEGLLPYSAVRMNYQHGPVKLVQNPSMQPEPLLTGTLDPVGWTKSGTAVTSVIYTDTNYAIKIPAIKQTANLPTTQGTGAGSWDALIQSKVGANTSGYSYTEASGLEAGTSYLPSIEFYVQPLAGFTLGGIELYGNRRRVAAQVRIADGTNTYYLQEDGSWGATVTWITRPIASGWNTWVITQYGVGTDALPATASSWTMRFSLGPVFEQALVTAGSGAVYTLDYVLYDNADIAYVLPDGTFNPDVTATINYVDRNLPRIKEVDQHLGDGPTAANDTTLTMNASVPLDVTSDWEEGNITGSASGDSIDELLSRIHLRAQRNPRKTHNARYYSLTSLPGPCQAIVRSGANYAALEMTRDWEQDFVEGRWYRVRQDGFTDDLETGVYSDGKSLGAFSGGNSVGFLLERLSDTFFTEASKRVAVTTAVIAAGATTSLTVASDPDNAAAGIVEPLLKADDHIVLVAPDLSYHVLTLSANQAAAATTIAIDSYTFPEEVPYPASIFFVEDELLTLARLGEQGFAVTVNATPLGKINGNQSGTVTSLNVKEWIGSVDSGGFVYLSNGTKLTLTADVRAGASSIAFTSTNVGTLLDDDPIYANGQVRRSEFLVASDKITAYIERSGDQIAVVQTNSSDTTIPVLSLSMDLFVGDYIFITRVNSAEEEPGSSPGEVIKAKVAAAATASGSPTSITVTTNTVVYPGDIITPSYLAGVRVDQDGVIIRHSHLKSEDWDGVVSDAGVISNVGTAGWIISASGEAVFNDVTVRGTVTNSTGSYVIDEDGLSLDIGATPGTSRSIIWDDSGTDVFSVYTVKPVGTLYSTNLISSHASITNSITIGAYNTGAATSSVLVLSSVGAATLDGNPILTDSAGLNGAAALTDPGADRIMFWDESANAVAWLALGTNLSITGTTINATAGGVSTLDDVGDVNATGVAQGALLYRNATEWIYLPASTAGRVLRTAGAGANPYWDQLASSDLSDAANVAHVNAAETISATWLFNQTRLTLNNATSGVTTLNAGDPVGSITLTLPTTNGETIVGTSTSQTLINKTLSTGSTWSGNTIGTAYGGTNLTGFTAAGRLLYSTSSSALTTLAIGSSGTFLKSNGSAPSWATIAASDLSDGANIAHINAAETISGVWQYQIGKLALQNVTSGLTTLNAGDAAGNITLTLPVTTSTLLSSADSINALSDVTITSAAEGNTLVHDGSAWINAAPAWHNVYSMYTQDSTASNSQTSIIDQTAVGSRTIAAGTLKAGTIVHFRAWGTVTTDTENLTLRFFFNTTGSGTEAFSLSGPTTDSLIGAAWTLDVWCVVKTTGGSGTMQVSGRYWVNGAEAAITPAHITSQQETIDTTAANIVNLTAQWSAAGTSTIYCDHAAIDMTRQAF